MSDRPLHVLFVARWYPSHDQPGRGTFVADLASALIATGRAEIVVASFEPTHVRGVSSTRPEHAGDANDAWADAVAAPETLNRPTSWGVPGISVARLPAILDGDRRRPSDVVDAHAALLRPFARGLVDRWPVDIIHAHTGLPDGSAALRIADELDLPLIVTEHASTTADELADADARALYARLLTPPRRLVAVSRALAREIARALGVAETTIDVLPNAVPIDGFPAGAASAREAGELLYVGSRKASKGIETLLRAFAEIRGRRSDVRLRLIGSPGQPADDARWHALVDDLAVADAVTFEPAASREAVAAAMRRATLFVHPSPHETFGVVAAEALASGLPVAATPSGGVDEIVGRDGRFGAVAASLSVPALADAIERGLASAARSDPAAMRAHVERNYAAEAVATRALDVYRRVIAATGATPRRPNGDADEDVTSSGPSAGLVRLPLIVALARGQAVERVSALPAPLRDCLTIVTSPRGRYADDVDLPDWGDWLELDQERFFRDAAGDLEASYHRRSGMARLRGAFGGPTIESLRRDLEGRRDEIRREGTARFLADAASRIPAVGSGGLGPTTIVALDADDVLLADRLGGGVGPVAPGGLRWLADAWDAAGRPL